MLKRFILNVTGGIMSVHERRKKPRNLDGLEGSAFIEISHTFGPIRKSVYKAVEYDEHGVSFLVPISDGYFRPGQPLEYSLVTPESTKIESFGTVRYYLPYNDQLGNSYYRIGIERNRSDFNKIPNALKIRPRRIKCENMAHSNVISFVVSNTEYEFLLVDISRYSASFMCNENDAFDFATSNALTCAEIICGSKLIFSGTVVVTKRTLFDSKYQIVIEPRSAVFNIDAIEEQERLFALTRSVDTLMHVSSRDQEISSEYKAAIADMRIFLEGYREILDLPTVSHSIHGNDGIAILDELSKSFFPRFDKYWAELDSILKKSSLSETDLCVYKSYCQRHLHPLIMSSPFCRRIYLKPLGYPGDYEMMRMLRDNEYDGPTLFAKLLNKYALNIPPAEAARHRNKYIAEKIAEFVRNHQSSEVRILSIASGPAMEIQSFIETYPELANRVHITLMDQEIEALRYSQDCIYMKRIMYNSNIKIELAHQNLGAFIRNLSIGDRQDNRFNMIYIFGLFDYFDDRVCRHFIKHVSRMLNEGGKMLISNFSPDNHHHRIFMEFMFEWYIEFRTKERMEELGSYADIPCSVNIEEDPTSVIKFLDIQAYKKGRHK